MTFSPQQLEQDFENTAPDASIVAEEWVKAAANIKPNVPAAADLAEMVTGIGLDFTMQGAPELEIDLIDEDWRLLDTGFFDPRDKGTLDRIDINYPQGSKYFWRIFQFSPSGNFIIKTYWIPRVVGDLMSLNAKHNPLQASRSTRTRAQFIKMAVSRAAPYARFHSRQLDNVQPIASLNIPTSGTSIKSAQATGKAVGISKAVGDAGGLTVKGNPLGDNQRKNLNVLLRAADKYGAGQVATEALIYAGIWESNLEDTASNTNPLGTFWGVLSGNANFWSQADTAGMAGAFLTGNSAKGFQGGGAIALSATITNPIEIAVKVEVPSNWPANAYAKQAGYPGDKAALAEVDALIQAGGGATGVGGVSGAPVEPVQQYNFQVGTTQSPNEDYWSAVNRLAQEVNWEIVVDADDVYYDSDVTLCRAQVDAVVDRKDPVVTQNWSYDWDRTQLPTNFQLELQCGPFDFRAADVMRVTSFGPASVGSTIKLPGRWLVGEIIRQPGDIVSTLTLVQPTQPLPEPAPTTGTPTTKPDQVTITGKAVNPFIEATGFTAGRTDMGVDADMQPGSQIVAPFDSMYLGTMTGWFEPKSGAQNPGGGYYIAFQIVGGTYNGWAYYLAEQINPKTFAKNQIIKAGTVIATYAAAGTGIEMGLANPKNWQQTLSQANGTYSADGTATPEGKRWRAILKALGAAV